MKRLSQLMALLAVGCLVLAIGFGVVAFNAWRAESALAQRGVTTNGSVTVSHYAPGGTSSITVSFTDTRGAPREGSIDVAASPPPTGTSVMVTYDPEDPTTLQLGGTDKANNMSAQGWAGVSALFAVIGAAAAGLWLFLRNRPGTLFARSA